MRQPKRGAKVCRGCGGGAPQVRKAAARRRAEEDAKERLKGMGKPVPHNLSQGVLDEIFWLKGSILFIKEQIEDIDPEAIVWGVTDYSDKTGGEDWGVKVTEKAAVNIWVKLLQEQQKLYLEFVTKAHAMGIEERRIKLAEQFGNHLLMALRIQTEQIRRYLVQQGWDDGEFAEVWPDLAQTVIPETLRELKEAG